MQKRPLLGAQTFTACSLAATVDGAAYSSAYNQESDGHKTGRFESGAFVITLATAANVTEMEVCVQHSDDGSTGWTDAKWDDLADPTMAEEMDVSGGAGTILQYHVNLNALKQYYRLRVTADGIDTLRIVHQLYNGRVFPVPVSV